MPKVLVVLLAAVLVLVLVRVTFAADTPLAEAKAATVQGKTVQWWARHAVQARKDANARRTTVIRQRREIKQLRRTILYQPSVEESIKLATLVYPRFTSCRAWKIIRHESWMVADPLHAKNPRSTATGLYQFLTSTFASTPFAGLSIYSPYAQSLAAGWMHQNGRGREWAIPDC